jgi:hypothetical protein
MYVNFRKRVGHNKTYIHRFCTSANVECSAFEIASGSEMSTVMSAGSADVLDGSGVVLDASVHRRHVKSMMIRRLRALK